MEVQRHSIVLHIFISLLIHTQIKSVGSLNQASISSVDLKHHHLTVETISFPADIVRRQLAGGGGGGGGGGSRGGGSSGGSSSGGGSRGGGSSGGGSSSRGGSSGGGSRGGSGGGSRGNKGGKGGGDDGDDGGDGGNSGGSSGNSRPSTPTQGGGRPVPIIPGGRFPSEGVRLQYSLVLFILATCLVVMY